LKSGKKWKQNIKAKNKSRKQKTKGNHGAKETQKNQDLFSRRQKKKRELGQTHETKRSGEAY
jgi:hypothetical protein